jgi:hypothetical protein
VFATQRATTPIAITTTATALATRIVPLTTNTTPRASRRAIFLLAATIVGIALIVLLAAAPVMAGLAMVCLDHIFLLLI